MDAFQKALSRAFESTLTEEIIPGMVHNFANPLNGIMGRSKLLQRKLEMNTGSTADANSPEELHSKLSRDVELISRDTDKLAVLLKNVAEKFHMVNKRTEQRINLSDMIMMELAFFDFYLDFKHNIVKKINVTPELPEITAAPADFSLALWGVMRHAMQSLKEGEQRDLHISIEHNQGQIRICFADSGSGIPENEWAHIAGLLEAGNADGFEAHPNYALLLNALCLLKKYHARFGLETGNGLCCLTVLIPVSG